jgi:hypothetical protein
MEDWEKLIFSEGISFKEKAFKVFEYQFKNNEIYHDYCTALHKVIDYSSNNYKPTESHDKINNRDREILSEVRNDIDKIPLFPIRGFKDAVITCNTGDDHDLIFKSSGTSGMERSRHPVADTKLYRNSLLNGFRNFYDLDNSVILAYTPGYSDNPNSSLVWMINELIKQDVSDMSRFLPLNKPLNQDEIKNIKASGKQLILFGAAFGLLDLVEISEVTLPTDSIIIETGGMKTQKREIGRMDMHRKLSKGFGIELNHIHSEYGMAEMLSQAYATGGKWFRTPPWLKVKICDPNAPQETLPPFTEGLIGVIDLANVHSCSFLLTGDKGIMDRDNRFQVLGRWNPKDLRGCNFLIEED